jgi:hypothetical protein
MIAANSGSLATASAVAVDRFAAFKSAPFNAALLTAMKAGQRGSPHVSVGKGRPRTGPSSLSRQPIKPRGRMEPGPLETVATPLVTSISAPPTPPIPRYVLRLVYSYKGTPDKLELLRQSEEWRPRPDELKQVVDRGYLSHFLFEIFKETGLWDALRRKEPDCKYSRPEALWSRSRNIYFLLQFCGVIQ